MTEAPTQTAAPVEESGAEEKKAREPLMTGWTATEDGSRMTKTVECETSEAASTLARKLLKVAHQNNAPIAIVYDDKTVRFEIAAEEGKIAPDAIKLARALRTSNVGKIAAAAAA